ncbi:type II secretion system protein GspK [Cognatiyoonia sp. IB215182]|uniref:type II secretion system protein GspK n=1 Tax=Cognatiyoonia sp. IB215182 TaxID=3097353 RepID=UPI002A0BEB7A|nr:type II secretion system protein GspK [Cognatiyoonia sp. IB215182]MDX8353208.1 type II secretion system protein GspK [Cognatiyoonia sp. IB215182]
MRRALSSFRRRAQRGFVLITVLWVALGLLLAASSYLVTQRQTALATRAEVETTRAVELARSAINVAMADLGRIGEEQTRSRRDGTPVTITMAEGQATYRIWDEGGKLDINAAPVELLGPVLQRLGESSGIDAFDAVTIAQALVTQRADAGSRNFSRPIPQLLTDLGLPQNVSLRARQVLTTYNGTPQVNPVTASPALLAAIPGLGPSDVEWIVQRRNAGQSLPRLGTASVWLGGTEGPVYTIEARSTLQSGVSVDMIATVAAQGISFRGGIMRYDILGVEILR